MWPNEYQERLLEWSRLRNLCRESSLEDCLDRINDWWQRAPVVNHYLHWDDWRDWPDPWTLLAEDIWCDVAKSLGICYTLMMIDHPDITDYQMVTDNETNLVLVNQGKYILNWAPGEIVNTHSEVNEIKKTVLPEQLKHHLR